MKRFSLHFLWFFLAASHSQIYENETHITFNDHLNWKRKLCWFLGLCESQAEDVTFNTESAIIAITTIATVNNARNGKHYNYKSSILPNPF